MMAVERILERILEDEDVAVVMGSHGLCCTTGYKWLAKVRGRGRRTHCLVARKGMGRSPKLTWAQKSQVFRWVNGKNPDFPSVFVSQAMFFMLPIFSVAEH